MVVVVVVVVVVVAEPWACLQLWCERWGAYVDELGVEECTRAAWSGVGSSQGLPVASAGASCPCLGGGGGGRDG